MRGLNLKAVEREIDLAVSDAEAFAEGAQRQAPFRRARRPAKGFLKAFAKPERRASTDRKKGS